MGKIMLTGVFFALLCSPMPAAADDAVEFSSKMLLKKPVECKKLTANPSRKQELAFQALGNNVCCCDTIDGQRCCGYATQCGGPIPGCNCR